LSHPGISVSEFATTYNGFPVPPSSSLFNIR
jgi:hypothetical protein